jgi:cytochrome d ubiquinol oxidase subunit I
MQTPAGYRVAADGRLLPTDWLAVIFNPSFFVRFPHMVLASYLSVAFVVGAVGAWHLLATRGQNQGARTMFSMAMWMAVLVAPTQVLVGDLHGLNTLRYQPAKIAALEGDWDTKRGAGEIIVGWPDMKAETTKYALTIPYLGSLILTHELNGEVPGLKQFPPADRPYAPLIFWTFRVMVAIGLLMAGLGLWSLVARTRDRLFEDRWLHWCAVVMGPSGFIAVICGWMTTEVGRQPYTVYGLMRTADSVSPVGAPGVAASLLAFIAVYGLVFGAGLLFILRLMAHAPQAGEAPPDPHQPQRAGGIVPGPVLNVADMPGAAE